MVDPRGTGPWSSLCEDCGLVRVVATPKGSRFLLCERSRTDPRFAKYPPQPVAACVGFEPRGRDGGGP